MKDQIIIQGDCLKVMKEIGKESVDLIYLDPPFFSKKDYDMPFGDKGSVAAFKDSVDAYEKIDMDMINKRLNIKLIHSDNDFWKRDEAGLLRYLVYMKDRLEQCYKVLKLTGSIYLHCDWHASHYLKLLMDEIFGYKNFRNEIVWHYDQGARSKITFGNKHDIIFWYSKTKEWTFNKDSVLEPFKSGMTEWRYTKGGQKGKNMPKGKVPSDVWDITFNTMAKERLGYPTQKPEALLERIIKASSNEGDVVLDPFCGCGTTIAVAARLKRNFIGIDISPIACEVMKERLKKIGIIAEMAQTDYSIEDINEMDWFEFQQWACNIIHAVPGGKGADGGIDGEGIIKYKGKEVAPFLVQVKKWKANVGDDRVRAFKGALDNKETIFGIIIANKFSGAAIEQANSYYKRGQATICLITTSELLEKNFDIKKRTGWNISSPDYVPWRTKNKSLGEFL